MVYSNQEAHEMMLILGECRGIFAEAARVWHVRYPDRTAHSRNVFSRLSRRVRNEGIIQPHHNKGRQIRRRVRNGKAPDVIASVHVSPHDSLNRRSIDAGIGKATIWRILRENKFHPYRMSLHQDLNENDLQRRMNFCNWIERQPPNFHRNILFSDECTFKSNAEVNTWNFRYWSQTNPHWLREVDHQHVWKVNVWCGIYQRYIVGPVIIEPNLNGPRYRQLIRRNLPDFLADLPLQQRLHMWFQQDGCPAHTSTTARRLLNDMFPDRWIDIRGPVEYPPRSPDLTVLDYYLWGRIKDLVYRERPTTRNNMIDRITEAIRSLSADEILRAVDCFPVRVRACIQQNGAVFEHMF